MRAVIQAESAFNPRARSVKGAMGLMQLMPATAAEYGRRGTPTIPHENIRAGVAYLRSLLTGYSDDEELALAAYNAGPGAVEKYGERCRPTGRRATTSSASRAATKVTPRLRRRSDVPIGAARRRPRGREVLQRADAGLRAGDGGGETIGRI